MQRLRYHAASVGQEQQHNGMELERCALQHSAPWHAFQDPTLRNEECKQRHDTQASGNRKAFEVFRLAVGVFGHVAGGDVEASEACKAGENEAGQEELVQAGAEARSECAHGGSDAEGDLGPKVS